ncbi:unnamed protein product [Camellia sinensis]
MWLKISLSYVLISAQNLSFNFQILNTPLSLPPSKPIPLPETQPRTPITLFLPLCLCHPSSLTVAAPNALQKEESKGIRRIGSRHQVLQRRKTGTTPREGQWLGWGWGWMRMERPVVRL